MFGVQTGKVKTKRMLQHVGYKHFLASSTKPIKLQILPMFEKPK